MTQCCDSTILQLPNFKRGDTFNLACVYKQNGTPVSVAPFTIRAQLRDSGNVLIQELAVSKANQTTSPGSFTISAGATIGWPIDLLRGDIQFTENGNIRSTETFSIQIIEGVTD